MDSLVNEAMDFLNIMGYVSPHTELKLLKLYFGDTLAKRDILMVYVNVQMNRRGL